MEKYEESLNPPTALVQNKLSPFIYGTFSAVYSCSSQIRDFESRYFKPRSDKEIDTLVAANVSPHRREDLVPLLIKCTSVESGLEFVARRKHCLLRT
ncbi:hypothetical protein TNIN_454561 [Trichonephila inaurata madagascariensis]|uniref:Uncharacterized protein n=1 Tax=Trichonephila inaurata madagascariensis TaxID=2747483 RepID=A0A8X6YMG8_9ARAC|nr:hypothetical protein TNIN_454561 [Trichonephila inaurata madagascariensis]